MDIASPSTSAARARTRLRWLTVLRVQAGSSGREAGGIGCGPAKMVHTWSVPWWRTTASHPPSVSVTAGRYTPAELRKVLSRPAV